MWSQSVDVARWVRPAIEHAQDVLSGGLGQEWEYDFVLCLVWFFKGPCFVLTFYVILFFVFLLFRWLCPFLKNQIGFGLGLSCVFWCFIVSFLDLVIVFKRIRYPVLSWFNPVWVLWVFFS